MKYRSNFFLFLFFLFSIPLVQAQRVGLSGGASVDPITSFRLSTIVESGESDWLSWQTELSYFQKGQTSLVDRLVDRVLEERPDFGYGALDMISWPVFLKLKMQLSDFSVYLMAGPEIGYIFRGLVVYSLEDGSYKRESVSLENYQIKRWDLGATIGMGLEKKIRKDQRIFVDFRYYQGFNNINLDTSSVLSLEAFYFNFGMFIPLQKAAKEQSQAH